VLLKLGEEACYLGTGPRREIERGRREPEKGEVRVVSWAREKERLGKRDYSLERGYHLMTSASSIVGRVVFG